jgi:protein SCO1/2
VSIDPTEDLRSRRARRSASRSRRASRPRSGPSGSRRGRRRRGARARRRRGFKYKYDEQSKQYAHEAVAFLLAPGGIVARYLYGVEHLARDFRLAVVESGDGRVGTSLDKVILSCYKYDP